MSKYNWFHRLNGSQAVRCIGFLFAISVLSATPNQLMAAPSGVMDGGQSAPLNPAFVAYQESLKNPGVLGVSPKESDGHGRGYAPSPLDLSYLTTAARMKPLDMGTMSFSSSFDLRTEGRVTAVRNQGSNGTCWAHAAIGSMESILLPAESHDFSENNLANLHGFDGDWEGGGSSSKAEAYFLRWNGPVDEADDPYPNENGSPTGLSPVKHVQNVVIIPAKSSPTDNDRIKQALMDYGGLCAAYFDLPIHYNSTTHAYYCASTNDSNHLVTIVGWDDNYSSANFRTTPPGNGAYLVRNSWGTGWGDNGYYYVSYYDGRFARYAMSAFLAEPTTRYNGIYQYDPLGWVGWNYYTGCTTVWGANVFLASESKRLGAVGFYATELDTSYTICVYTNVTTGLPRSGTLAATKNGSFNNPGYYTVPLDQTVALTAGQNFSIVVQFTSSRCSYYRIPTEVVSAGYSSAATASPNQSFYGTSGTSWWDKSADPTTPGNVCIKGYLTTDQTLPSVTINQAAGQADPTSGATINFTVVFSEAVTNFVSSDVTLSGTATGTKTATVTGSGTTYNVAVSGITGVGTVSVSIPASVATDSVGNPNTASTSTDNTVTYALPSVVTSVSSVSVPEGSTATFQVKLSNQPAASTVVTVARASGDSDITVTGGASLTFTTSNWNSYQIVTLSAAQDSDTANSTATLSCSATGFTTATVTATETDNDTTLTVTAGTGGTASPSGATVVPKSTSSAITATPSASYTFANWTCTSGSATFGNANAASTTATISAPATVRANFTANTVAIVAEISSVSVPEGSTATFRVKLSAQPAANTDVTVSRASGDSNITVSGGASLTFTTSNWNSYQTVTLTAAQDSDTANDTATISCSASGLTTKTVTATEADNDTTLTVTTTTGGTTSPSGATVVTKGTATNITATPSTGYTFTKWTVPSGLATLGYTNAASTSATLNSPATVQANFTANTVTIVVDQSTVTVSEGATAIFWVKLSAQPMAITTVAISKTSGDSDITVTGGASLTFSTATWDSYQKVTLSAAHDNADAANGTATISCTASGLTTTTVTATEDDNETTLTVTAGTGGTASPSVATVVTKGISSAISATPSDGYTFANWTCTSGSATFGNANTASTTTTISAPATVRANFTANTVAIVVEPSSVSVPEGATATFRVKLSAQPTGITYIMVERTAGDTNITVIGGVRLTFSTSGSAVWDNYQTVTLAAAQDADNMHGTCTIRCSATGLANVNVTAREIDDDVNWIDRFAASDHDLTFQLNAPLDENYILQRSTNLIDWVTISNASPTATMTMPRDTQLPACFFRMLRASLEGMVQIPAGTNSGTDPDFGAYSLTVDTAFYMDSAEVTKAQWDEVYTWALANGYGFDNVGLGKAADHPVQTVNWYDCVKWCNARSQKEGLTPCYSVSNSVYKTGAYGASGSSVITCDVFANGYRLPTITEWEYAARGGLSGMRFPWGDTITHSQANYTSSSSYSYDVSPTRGHHPTYSVGDWPYTSSVRSFAPNSYGMYDMTGNIREWCWDASGQNRYSLDGGWFADASWSRCGYKIATDPSIAGTGLGFRTVCR